MRVRVGISPCAGRSGHGPSLPSRITSRLAGIRGGPRGAVSDVGDPTERLISLTAFRLATLTTLYGPRPDPVPLRESPLTRSILAPARRHLLATAPGRPAGSRPTAWGRVPAASDPRAPAAARRGRAPHPGRGWFASIHPCPLHHEMGEDS